MITMVIIAAAALMLTFTLMRTTASRSRRDRDGIRWRGIDWSASEADQEPDKPDYAAPDEPKKD
jgi:hypothetical protein